MISVRSRITRVKLQRQVVPLGIVVLVTGVIGTHLLIGSHAATPVVSITADRGQLNGAVTVKTDSTASSGNFAQFGGSTVGSSLSQYVDPFIGTTHNANMWPDAVYPTGMVQVGPDTITNPPGGYVYTDTTLKDFSVTHFSGRGCQYLQDIPIMPFMGSVTSSPASNPTQYYSSYSHNTESAKPGYYKVYLNTPNILAELTATLHTAYGQFTYPAATNASMLVNPGGSINGQNGDIVSNVSVASNTEIIGSAHTAAGCGTGKYTVYFSAQFDHPFTSSGTWNGGTVSPGSSIQNGKYTGAYVTFNTSSNQVVHVKIGISYISIANAENNISTENSSGDFHTLAQNALTAWDNRLNIVAVQGGTADEKTSFYTALYHFFMHPNIFNDANGQYIGFDNKVHLVTAGHNQYENIPGWDGYRSTSPLRALLTPQESSDISQSLVNDAQQGDGHLPRWEQTNFDSLGMSGDSADPWISSAYALGATNFDSSAALQAMINGQSIIREGYSDYTTLGYVSNSIIKSGSRTLEYANDDFALSQFARALHDPNTCSIYEARSNNWQNLFNQSSLYIQPRQSNGTWEANFNPTNQSGFEEGNSADYTWLVQGHLPDLFAKIGGNTAVTARLSGYFANPKLGNEQLFEIPWEYDFSGSPSKTQKIVRDTQLQLFNSGTGGLPGNDDGGAISSWYIFSVFGLYPEISGAPGLVVGSPLFSSITIHPIGGRVIQINASNASDATPYVQSLSVNGQSTNNTWVSWDSLKNGAALNFGLTNNPTNWGTGATDAPPVFNQNNACL